LGEQVVSLADEKCEIGRQTAILETGKLLFEVFIYKVEPLFNKLERRI
jgi:hypothetical protein